MTARILLDCSPSQYHADPSPDPSLSSTVAKLLCFATPAHAKLAHPRLTLRGMVDSVDDPTPAQLRGTLTHALVLGKGADIVEVNADDWKTKAAREARTAIRAEGKQAVLVHKLAESRLGAITVRARLAALGYDLAGPGESEVVILAHLTASDGTRVPARIMVDRLAPTFALDLKTLESAHPDSCQRQANQYGHNLQRAFYVKVIEAYCEAAGIPVPPFRFAFAETDAPHAVTISDVDGSGRELGEMQLTRAVDLWAACIKTGVWPARYRDGRTSLRAAPWDLQAEMGYLL